MTPTDATHAPSIRPTPAPANAVGAPVTFEEFVARLPAKERGAVLRHEAACEEVDPAHADLWRRIVRKLASLAPHAVRAIGQHTLQFFIADGKYRRQVFALDDHRDSKLIVYSPDVLDAALQAGVVAPAPEPAEPRALAVPGSKTTLFVEQLDSTNTPNPDASFKHMLGWNRKATRTTLLSSATPPQVEAAEAVWALAAKAWTPKG
ncbi:MAG: hypothetical protein JWL69_4108 [Phycisphaerales bacterium]|nr:hypothetical protein [Phycisphaerales bacterium]MDB5356475.1 hypothetical protein [Phycisphaerales bacterium]